MYDIMAFWAVLRGVGPLFYLLLGWFKVKAIRFRAQAWGLNPKPLGFRAWGLGVRAQGLGFGFGV